jgi:hypothetical protein
MNTVRYAFSLRNENWNNEDLDAWADYLESTVKCPSSVLKDISESRKNVVFLKCPAHTDFLKNTFVFKSPIDVSINVEADENFYRVWSDNLSQPLFEKIIDGRFLNNIESGQSPYPLLGIDFLNYFEADVPTILSVTPAFLHHNDFTKKTSIIPGEFDISKWFRSVECVFEIKKDCEKIDIKKGDAICYFKLKSENNEAIKLTESQISWNKINQCAELRNKDPFKPLKFRYESVEKIIKQNP